MSLQRAQLRKRWGRWEPLLHVSGAWGARLGDEKETPEPLSPGQTDRHTAPLPGASLMLSTRGRCFQVSLNASVQSRRSTLSLTVGGGGWQGCGAAGDTCRPSCTKGVWRGRRGPRGFPTSFLPLPTPAGTRARSSPTPPSVQPSEGSGRSWACGSDVAKQDPL